MQKLIVTFFLATGLVYKGAAGSETEINRSYSDTIPSTNVLLSKEPSAKSDSASAGWKFFFNEPGISMDKVRVWGNMRVITIYRNMKEAYPDMLTSERNFSFNDYPIVNVGTNNMGGVPMLELTMESNVTSNASFGMGYSYAHNFLGNPAAPGTNVGTLSSRSSMWLAGDLAFRNFSTRIEAGQILWARVSKFTMGQPIYRDNYFDRMPWDWYRSSFNRFVDYYDYTGNVGPEGFGRSPVQGVIMYTDIKPAKLSVTGVFGRTNRSLIQSQAAEHFPSLTYVLRLQKGLLTRSFTGRLGLNYYDRNADTDRIRGIKDQIQMLSLDFDLKRRGFLIMSEIGLGRINTPESNRNTGLAIDVRADIHDNILPIPVSLEYYDIDINAVTLDGSILNSNKAVRDGGFSNELIWDNMLFINIAQEADQIANNRRGFILKTKKSIGNFKAELSYALSQERENFFDTVTVQHRVNAFSRSRFRPWFQAGGPYGRIKSGWMRTFETFTITDRANGIPVDYKKGFNVVELLLKYKASLFARDLIFLNLTNYNSIQDHFSLIPKLNDKPIVRTFYNELTIAYAIGRSYMVYGSVGIERLLANNRTNLSPETGLPSDQTGYGVGLGLSYDFHRTAGIHLRHRWMTHEDKNFKADRFKGQESTVELKIFF
ncbi:MAG: hypothetical protein ACK40G_13975 [Cytophagaceae bacterium]